MIATPTGRNIGDFKQRYQGVVGFLRPAGRDRTLVFVYNVSSSKVTFRDHNNHEYYANVDSGVEFEFIPTQRAWYNTSNGTYYLQRVPARQWRRGICADNTAFIQLHKDTIGQCDEDWKMVAFNVMGNTLSYPDGVTAYLKGERPTCALSKHFALGQSVVYFCNLQVGTYSNRIITLKEEYGMLLQELSDVCKRNNFPFTVVVK